MHTSASAHEPRFLPADERSRRRLAERGLRYDLVDAADHAEYDAWIRANRRGFHAPEPEAEQLPRLRTVYAGRRLTGVWDDAATIAPTSAPTSTSAASSTTASARPIATIGSWRSDLTMPGGDLEPLYAISSVTVSPTHAGLGVARAMIEGELRTAARAGFALAGLTVTESGLYSRYGFGPSAFAASLEVDVGRAAWRGPETTGRVIALELDEAAACLAAVHDRARRRAPGDVTTGERFWRTATGADAPDEPRAREHRFVAHRTGDGEVDGAAIYRLDADPADFTKHTLVLEHLVAASDDAERALWRFLLRVPLVQTVRAELRPVDDPLRWLIDDARAVRATRVDHHWLRILDVPRALAARSFAGAGELELVVHDALGFAAGRYGLVTDALGRARVERLGDAPPVSTPGAHAPDEERASALELDVAALASLLLGGVSASELERAGRFIAATPEGVERADALFRVARAPWLSTWY